MPHFNSKKENKTINRPYYEIVETILLDYLFLLNRRSKMCISLNDFWKMDTYTLYEFLSKEYMIIADEKEELAKQKRKDTGIIPPKHENNQEIEDIFGDEPL